MLIFLDESGDPGFKTERGSSKFFVIALIIFDDDLEALKTQVRIRELRRALKLHDAYEFSFNRCSQEFRLRFLQAVASCKFRYRAIVISKEGVYSPELRRSKESFYNYAVKLVLKNNGGTIKNAKLRFDSHGERLLRRNLSAYLRREINTPSTRIFSDLKFRDSKADDLIQLADMVAGAIRRSFDDTKADAKEYRQVIRGREDDVWRFC